MHYKALEKDLTDSDDFEGWQRYREANEKSLTGINDSMVLKFHSTLKDTILEGIFIIEGFQQVQC